MKMPKGINKNQLLAAAGYRERDIISNCKGWSFSANNGYNLYTFYHKDGEHSATWSATLNRWIN